MLENENNNSDNNIENMSDGYHTFKELYDHRHALFLNLISAYPQNSWISKAHNDGTEWKGWFIGGMQLPTGTVTYHMPDSLWGTAQYTGAKVLDRAPEWDGHTSADVLLRLQKAIAVGIPATANGPHLWHSCIQ